MFFRGQKLGGELPWSYVGTVQPGGALRRRTRRGMVNFLRDYVKYVRAQQSTGGIPYSDVEGTGLKQTQPTKGLDPFQRKMDARRYSFGTNPCGGCPPGTKCVQLQHPITGVTWYECKEPRNVEIPLPDPFGESRSGSGGRSGTLTAPSGPRPSQTSNLNPLQRKLQANTFRPKRRRR
jgi:hypothetical protein